ncbi:MAG TPA: ferritin-like domain-containing protein [Solirubrobacteraceae bacterium]|nr:ferritin-like domain-containing protein [Solirubrobacteraceae bacterium]
MRLQSLEDVFQEQIEDLHSAENQLVAALPKVADAATDEKLTNAVREHLEQTREHVRRLDTIARDLGFSTSGEKCEAMAGLIRESEEIVSAEGDPAAKDAALIAAAQRVEHYEIAAYGTVKALAGELGYDKAKDLLDETLDEESQADGLLTKIATGGLLKAGVNTAAHSDAAH